MQGWFLGANGYHEPHLPPWVIVYWVFILKYFWNISNKSFKKNLEIFFFIALLCYGSHKTFV
jgi:hypothetical protein